MMNINGLQIASVIFSISMIYFSYFCFRKKYFSTASFLIWSIVFIALIVTTLYPALFVPFKTIFQVTRLFDLFVVIGLFFIIVLTFINFIHLQRLKKNLGSYVQNDAINDHNPNGAGTENDQKKNDDSSNFSDNDGKGCDADNNGNDDNSSDCGDGGGDCGDSGGDD